MPRIFEYFPLRSNAQIISRRIGSLALFLTALALGASYLFFPTAAVVLMAAAAFFFSLLAPKLIFFFLALGTLMRPTADAGLPLQDGWWILIATLLGLLIRWLRTDAGLRRSDWPVLLLLFAITTSSFVAIISGTEDANRHLAVIGLIILFLLTSNMFSQETYKKKIIESGRRFLLITGAALVFFTLTVDIYSSGLRFTYVGSNSLRFSETSPRSLVGISGALLIAAFFFPARSGKLNNWNATNVFLCAVILIGLLLAGIRMIVIAIILASIVGLMTSESGRAFARGKVKLSWFLGIALVALLTFAFLNSEKFNESLRIGQEFVLDENIRWIWWGELFRSMQLHDWVFGSGIGTESGIIDGHTHSFFVSVLFSFGAPALAALLILVLRDSIVSLEWSRSSGQIAVIVYCVLAFSSAGSADWPDFYVSYLLSYLVAVPKSRLAGC